MNSWREDLLNQLTQPHANVQMAFVCAEKAAHTLGFDNAAYGFQAPYPVTRPHITILSNYPESWQRRYAQAGYLRNDPTVAHGRKCEEPVLWTEKLFVDTPQLWADAQDHGLRVGWAQSSLDGTGAGSMLTLCRSHEALTARELLAREPHMRWLVQVMHVICSKLLLKQTADTLPTLSRREREVLKWTADGKSAQDIADILLLSKHAVDFHIKNVSSKLQVTNKTAAVARAALLGLWT